MDLYRFIVSCILIVGVSLPVIGLFICVSLCISVGACLGTDCTDINVLPSLSAAVSDEQPQRSVWMTFLLISSVIRLIFVRTVWDIYLHVFQKNVKADLSTAIRFQFIVAILEVIFLNLMGLFPSARFYESHRNCLAVFVFCSVIFMFCDTWLFSLLSTHTSSQILCILCSRCSNMWGSLSMSVINITCSI
ncbi:hypothetical protein EG68_09380 [Paragonimus skrjabini miyazakii]|uniref:CWH43-like N-terminal domain-containing protein n=1 Tax=Paragonimus skrjabini miyazakii TaxID=59628 RepID=A0A8S9YM68_9TREM|nr:hypothetical protein EG68_09380 [Paragonimus skrjabini miyazakii]